MTNSSIFDLPNDSIQSVFSLNEEKRPESINLKKLKAAHEKNGSFSFSLLIELIQRFQQSLESIKNLKRLSRGKFSDKVFEDHFHHILNEEIGRTELILRSVLNYLKVNTLEPKSDTVHFLIENTLQENQAQLNEKKIRVFKKFEKGLPETIIPDEHLKYILDSMLQYALRQVPPNGFIGFMTRTIHLTEGPPEVPLSPVGEGRWIEISLLFDGIINTASPASYALQEPSYVKREAHDFELRLIDEMVKENRGIMESGIDKRKGRTFIFLRFPAERRKVLCFPSLHPSTKG